jgi:hypothetical protein
MVILIITVIFGIMLVAADQSPLYTLALLPVAIVCYTIYSVWSPPLKHKDFSDSDRLEATSRALGGSPPPELWTPDMPEPKHHKNRKNTKT